MKIYWPHVVIKTKKRVLVLCKKKLKGLLTGHTLFESLKSFLNLRYSFVNNEYPLQNQFKKSLLANKLKLTCSLCRPLVVTGPCGSRCIPGPVRPPPHQT